jgi:hypothetical protein
MNSEMPRDLQRWAGIRQKGRPRFILVTGVLSYGVPMFVIMTFFVNRHPERPLTAPMLAVSAVIWALGGAAFGWVMWKITEGRYQKFLAKQGGKP